MFMADKVLLILLPNIYFTHRRQKQVNLYPGQLKPQVNLYPQKLYPSETDPS